MCAMMVTFALLPSTTREATISTTSRKGSLVLPKWRSSLASGPRASNGSEFLLVFDAHAQLLRRINVYLDGLVRYALSPADFFCCLFHLPFPSQALLLWLITNSTAPLDPFCPRTSTWRLKSLSTSQTRRNTSSRAHSSAQSMTRARRREEIEVQLLPQDACPASRSRRQEARCASPTRSNFKISKTIAAAHAIIKPGAIRETAPAPECRRVVLLHPRPRSGDHLRGGGAGPEPSTGYSARRCAVGLRNMGQFVEILGTKTSRCWRYSGRIHSGTSASSGGVGETPKKMVG